MTAPPEHPFTTPVPAEVHVVDQVTTVDGRTFPGPTLPCFALLDAPLDMLQAIERDLRPEPSLHACGHHFRAPLPDTPGDLA